MLVIMPARSWLVSGITNVLQLGVALFAYFFLLLRKSMNLVLGCKNIEVWFFIGRTSNVVDITDNSAYA
jgi:hypothetical protein